MALEDELLVVVETMVRRGIEQALRRFYGAYKARVMDVKDPEKRGRIRVQVEELGQDKPLEVWVDPMFDSAGLQHGMFFPPEEGDHVRVFFSRGDPSKPIAYLGGWYGEQDVPEEFSYSNDRPQKRGFISRMGHAILFSDEPGNEYVRVIWRKPAPGDPALTDPKKAADRTSADAKASIIDFGKDGSIQIVNQEGSMIDINATEKHILIVDQNGNSLTMDPDGVKIIDTKGNLIALDKGKCNIVVDGTVNVNGKSVNLSAGGVFLGGPVAPMNAVLGPPLLAWLASHIHGTGVGPSTPPLVPPTPSLLSQSVKLKP